MTFIFCTILFFYIVIGFMLGLSFYVTSYDVEDRDALLIAVGVAIIYPLYIPKYLIISVKMANSHFKDSSK